MNWILENLQLVVIVASAFAWWLSQRKKSAEEDAGPLERPEQPPADLDEQTRRIQDEIRRKIAERRGARPGPLEPPPVPVERRFRPDRPAEPRPAPRREVPEWTSADAATLERQRHLEEQMRVLEGQRRAVRAKAQEAFAYPASPILPAGPSRLPRARVESEWLQLLRDRRSFRQAVVLREILGPPAALK